MSMSLKRYPENYGQGLRRLSRCSPARDGVENDGKQYRACVVGIGCLESREVASTSASCGAVEPGSQWRAGFDTGACECPGCCPMDLETNIGNTTCITRVPGPSLSQALDAAPRTSPHLASIRDALMTLLPHLHWINRQARADQDSAFVERHRHGMIAGPGALLSVPP